MWIDPGLRAAIVCWTRLAGWSRGWRLGWLRLCGFGLACAIGALTTPASARVVSEGLTFIDEDITVLTPANPYRVEGIPDDREEFEWGIRTGKSRVGYFQEMQPRVQIYGDVAVVTYFSRGSYGPEETVAYLKETDVLVRRGDGWRIVHIHVSATR